MLWDGFLAFAMWGARVFLQPADQLADEARADAAALINTPAEVAGSSPGFWVWFAVIAAIFLVYCHHVSYHSRFA